jgi:hypothetical protein
MTFKAMDRSKLMKLTEGHRNVLADIAKEQNAFFASLSCLRCGTKVRKETSLRVTEGGEATTNDLARCLGCGCLFDPYLRIIVELGNLARLEPTIPIINPNRDED